MKKISYRELSDKVAEAICAAMDAPEPKSKTYVVEEANRAMYENGWTPEEYMKYFRENIASYDPSLN